MASIDRPPAKGNLGPFALRTPATPDQPPAHVPIPPRRRPLAEIRADPRYSNGAKLLAANLDGRCLALGSWAAWPKVSTIAHELGWGGDPRAFRKRVERAFRELIEGGDVARPKLGELEAWHDAEGARAGIAWPVRLRRGWLRRSAAVCVLGWKLAEAEGRLPSLTPCDIPVAPSGPAGTNPSPSDVALHAPEMSHGRPPEMSHPQNVRTLSVQSEPITLDAVACAGPEEEHPKMTTEPVTVGELPPAATPDRSRLIAAERLARELMSHRDLRARVDPSGAIEWAVPPGAGPAPDAAELAEVQRLKPEFLEALRSRGVKVPRSPSATPPKSDGSRPAGPKVPPGVRASIRAKLGRLRAESATNRDVAEAARELVAALGPHADHGKTVAKFHLLCGQVRKGTLPEATVQDAFEAACGKRIENRGALFVALVKRATVGEPVRGKSPV